MGSVIVIGGNGQLGTDCGRVFQAAGYAIKLLDHQQLDVTNAAAVEETMRQVRPDVVINTAAMHNVEACEADPAQAFMVNGLGARNVALATRVCDARLLHVSTDYVFDGTKPGAYTENDTAIPLNVYGNTKLSGEHFVLSEAPRGAVVRTSALYGSAPCRAKGGLNFVRLMLKLARDRGEVRVVQDEIVSPTYTLHLARQLLILATSDGVGLFHATSGGECSWFEFAEAIFSLSGTEVRLRPATSADFPAKVRRPAYSVLDNERLREAGIDGMPHWRASLESYLEEIGELSALIPEPIRA